jgi:hypothetical protein
VDVVVILGAIAAVLAAIFSGLALYVSGRREERRWRREQLTDAFQAFLAVSFDRSYLAWLVSRARLAEPTVELESYQSEETVLHGEHDRLLQRLRLLAPPSAVMAAEALHLGDHALLDPVLDPKMLWSDQASEAFEVERQHNRQLKEQMVDAARAALGLGKGKGIDDRFWNKPRSVDGT